MCANSLTEHSIDNHDEEAFFHGHAVIAYRGETLVPLKEAILGHPCMVHDHDPAVVAVIEEGHQIACDRRTSAASCHDLVRPVVSRQIVEEIYRVLVLDPAHLVFCCRTARVKFRDHVRVQGLVPLAFYRLVSAATSCVLALALL